MSCPLSFPLDLPSCREDIESGDIQGDGGKLVIGKLSLTGKAPILGIRGIGVEGVSLAFVAQILTLLPADNGPSLTGKIVRCVIFTPHCALLQTRTCAATRPRSP
jgi:hypothetical protein